MLNKKISLIWIKKIHTYMRKFNLEFCNFFYFKRAKLLCFYTLNWINKSFKIYSKRVKEKEFLFLDVISGKELFL